MTKLWFPILQWVFVLCLLIAVPRPAAADVLLAGTADSFAGGTEAASPSAAFLATLGAIKNFDATALNLNVGHTFFLPGPISAATLELSVMALPTSSPEGHTVTDGIFLDQSAAGKSIVVVRHVEPMR